MPAVLYSADVLCPMGAPPQPDAGVLVDGEAIAAVDARVRLEPHAARAHHVDGVLLPGLVDGHAALELTDLTLGGQTGSAPLDVGAVREQTRAWDEARWSRSAHRGVHRCLRAGATTVGDVVTRGPAVPASCKAGLAGDSWVEVALVDVEHHDAVLAGVEHALGLPAPGRRVGIASAGAHTLGTGVLQALATLAEQRAVPLHSVAGATQAEVAAIRTGTGPAADAARRRSLEFEWLDEGGTGLTPVRYLDACRVLRPGASLAHGVWVDEDEAGLLAERGVGVALCPGAAAQDAPLERYAAAGTALALSSAAISGSDGGPDLLAAAAAWRASAQRRGLTSWPGPDGPVDLAEQALRLATVDGAAAMGWGARAGVLAEGRRADLLGVALATTPERVFDDLLEAGAERQVLTVLGGVRKARRSSADEPWPPLEHEDLGT